MAVSREMNGMGPPRRAVMSRKATLENDDEKVPRNMSQSPVECRRRHD